MKKLSHFSILSISLMTSMALGSLECKKIFSVSRGSVEITPINKELKDSIYVTPTDRSIGDFSTVSGKMFIIIRSNSGHMEYVVYDKKTRSLTVKTQLVPGDHFSTIAGNSPFFSVPSITHSKFVAVVENSKFMKKVRIYELKKNGEFQLREEIEYNYGHQSLPHILVYEIKDATNEKKQLVEFILRPSFSYNGSSGGVREPLTFIVSNIKSGPKEKNEIFRLVNSSNLQMIISEGGVVYSFDSVKNSIQMLNPLSKNQDVKMLKFTTPLKFEDFNIHRAMELKNGEILFLGREGYIHIDSNGHLINQFFYKDKFSWDEFKLKIIESNKDQILFTSETLEGKVFGLQIINLSKNDSAEQVTRMVFPRHLDRVQKILLAADNRFAIVHTVTHLKVFERRADGFGIEVKSIELSKLDPTYETPEFTGVIVPDGNNFLYLSNKKSFEIKINDY